MSQLSQESSIPDAAIDALVNYAAEIFTENYIMDMGVRRQVAAMMLQQGDFIDHFGDRYELEKMLTGTTTTRDVFAMSKLNINLSVGLSASDKSQIVLANPDVNINIHDHSTHSHGKAYAQRVIDTTRLLTRVKHDTGSVLDIGGNYATHAFSEHTYEVHSCTLLAGAREHHRQVQRDVRLDYAAVDKIQRCTVGAQNCDYQSKEGISLHTLPNIDPEHIVDIVRRHGLEHVEGVHHYDVNIETHTNGFVPHADMLWYQDGKDIVFHFENDSSEDYRHKRDWLLIYATSWTKTRDDWEYVIHYTVNMVQNGQIYWTIDRLCKSTIGFHHTRPQHRFTPVDDVVELMVPEFDESLGFSVSDPRAYVIESVYVPTDLFTHVYKFGISNDTERPDLPLTFDHVRNQVQVFNQVRKVNGTSITLDRRIDSQTANRIARGLYLLIVKRAAANAVVYGKYTQHLKDIQKRWGNENFMFLASKLFATAAVYPFMMLATSFNEIISLMAMHMRNVVRDDRTLAAAQEIVPYKVMQPVRAITAIATETFKSETNELHQRVDFDDKQSIEDFYEALGDQMPAEYRDKLEKYLQSMAIAKEDAQKNEASTAPKPFEQNALEFAQYGQSRQEWLDAHELYTDQLGTVGEHYVDPDITYEPTVADEALVNQFTRERVYEFGLYLSDVGLHEVSKAKEWMSHTWSAGEPNTTRIMETNVLQQAEIRYFRLVDNVLDLGTVEDEYMVALNPMTGALVHLIKRGAGLTTINEQNTDFLMVCSLFKVFNHFKIARTCYELATSDTTFVKSKISLVNGVPGCGKTHEIVVTFEPDDVIVCIVKASVEDTLNQVYDKFEGKVSKRVLETRIRTLDSFLCNPKRIPHAKKLLFDEGLMAHSGAIAAMAQLTRARVVKIFGDTQQIKMIDRGSKLGVLKFVLYKYLSLYEERNNSYRMPADVTKLVSTFYPRSRQENIMTYSPIVRSLSYTHMPNVNNALYTVARPFFTYISVLQADKGTILKGRGFADAKAIDKLGVSNLQSVSRPVCSVHEAQGKTFAKVQISRLNPQTIGVFDSAEHQNVMLSRGTHVNEYVSVAQLQNDTIAQKIQMVLQTDDNILKDRMLDTPEWLHEKFQKIQQKISYV